MKLNAGNGVLAVTERLVRMIVQIRHCRFELVGQRFAVDRVSVVVRGDEYVACKQVLYRLISAAMSVRELVGARSAGEREELMSQTDAVQRLAADEFAQNVD